MNKRAPVSGNEAVDYVVVGSGAGGSIVAARLSEDADRTICLLESGPQDHHPFIHLPGGFIKLLGKPAYTWQFATEASAHVGGRSIPMAQGRTVGGSTSINGMIFNRGQRGDFDGWASDGATGWAYADVLPYFKKLETVRFEGSDYRGGNGGIDVSVVPWRDPACEAFIAGAIAAGIPLNPDYNGKEQAGVNYTQQAIFRGRRVSAAGGFLRPALKRKNIELRVNSTALEIMFSGKRAIGVRYRCSNGEIREIMASREVIICAGAINTPRLLQVSGIGSPELLRSLGVKVVHALPGVGQNLRDHFLVRLSVKARGFESINQLSRAPKLWGQIARWAMGAPSIIGMCPSPVHFFWKSRPVGGPVDLQGFFTPGSYKLGPDKVGVGRELDDVPGMTCAIWQHKPESAGYVQARSRDMSVGPIVQPNYLADQRDCEVIIAGLRLAKSLLKSPALASLVESESMPGPEVRTDEQLLDYARRIGITAFHPMGTSRMGPLNGLNTVVDAELRVHGISGLRIVDASVMPNMPSANTAVSTMMIAEKAADMIRGRAPLPSMELY
jgi:choline dehydrogenase